jgi:hypothetical protein
MIIIYSFPHPGEGKQNIKGGKEGIKKWKEERERKNEKVRFA